MILGYRDLTRSCAPQQSLTFDVMPMPRVGSGATIAEMSGLCISAARSTPTRRPTSSPR